MAAEVFGNSVGRLRQQNNGEHETMKRAKKKHMFFLPGGVPFEVDVNYAPFGLLGKGAYGVVCSCINRETGEKVAVKKISNPFEHETTALRTLREVQILRQIGGGHVNVIELKDVMLSSSSAAPSLSLGKSNFRDVYLVQELMESDLHDVIRTEGQPLAPFHVKRFMYQILRGLSFLHSNNIIHRDLKPANILVNKSTGLVKISDFGLARTKIEDPQKMTEYVVTRWYRAPELLTGASWYGNAVDMCSAGCILAEMLAGRPLFPAPNCLAQIIMIYSFLGKKPGDLSHMAECCKFQDYLEKLPYSPPTDLEKMLPGAEPQALDLLKSLLVVDPWDRLSASQALQHPYFKDLYFPSEDDLSAWKGGLALDVDWFRMVADESMIREMIWEEMLYYHPEQRTMISPAI